MAKFKVVDLFSGCGGFSYGFQEAGYKIVLGVDNTKIALETFKLNHKNSEAFELDLFKDESISKIAKYVDSLGGVDVIISGPPCQGFSLTGTRNENDERNKLFYSVFKIAKSLENKPKAIIIENVPGIAKLYDGKAKINILNKFDSSGYNCSVKQLYAPDFGVPQIRKRMFFVGILKSLGEYEFPEPILDSDEYVNCSEAIGDLPPLIEESGSEVSQYSCSPSSEYQKLMRKDSEILFNHVATRHTELVKNVISLVPEGGNYKNLPPGIGESRRFHEAWTRYHSRKPAKTIDTGHRNHFHYKWNRVPTVRENARLQSFPDIFRFLGNRTEQNRQVGNAVPPLLGFHIATQLKRTLKAKG